MKAQCSEIRDVILRGEIPTGADVQAHADGCVACQSILEDRGELGHRISEAASEMAREPDADLNDLWKVVEGDVAADRGARAWLRSRATPQRVGILLAVGGILVLWQLLLSARADFGVYPVSRLLLEVSVYTALVLVGVWIMLHPLQRKSPPNWLHPAVVGAVLAFPVVVALVGPAHQALPVSLEGVGADFVPRALACFLYGSALALPFVLLAWAFKRLNYEGLDRLLLTAASGGLIGNFVLHMHCPLTDPRHMLVGHATIGFVFAIVYGAVGLVSLRRRDSV